MLQLDMTFHNLGCFEALVTNLAHDGPPAFQGQPACMHRLVPFQVFGSLGSFTANITRRQRSFVKFHVMAEKAC